MLKPGFAVTPIGVSALLFIVQYFWFQHLIKTAYYFQPDVTNGIDHIIDVHLQHAVKNKSSVRMWQRLYDPGYVKKAVKQYDPVKYMGSHFVLDIFFPFVYGFLFLSLAGTWDQTRFYVFLHWAVVACVAFDLLENAAFAFYLFHSNSRLNYVVAFCTTVKSLLFVACSIAAVGAFVAGCVAIVKR